MVNCAECDQPAQRGNKDTISCKTCNNFFHNKCGGLGATDVTFLREQNKLKLWKCKKCEKKLRSELRSENTPIKIDKPGEKSTTEHGTEQITQKTQSCESLNYGALMLKINDLIESNNFLALQQQEATKSLTEATKEIKMLNLRIIELQNDNVAKEKRIAALESRVNIMEQKELENKVEIYGLQLNNNNNNLEERFDELCASIKIDVKKDIFNLYIRRRESTNKSIVVVFHTKQAAAELLRKRGKHNFENNVIYINECLTAYNRNLLWKVKNKAKENNFKFTWIKDGKILCRKTEGDKILFIRSEQDLTFLE